MSESGVTLAVVLKWLIVVLICGGIGYRILAGLFERELTALEGLAMLAGTCIIAGIAIKLVRSYLFFPFLTVIGFSAIALSSVPARLQQRKRREMWQADLIRYKKALAHDPTNVAAYSFIADAYVKLGDLNQAIENYEKALELDPALVEEKRKLTRAVEERSIARSETMYCPRCLNPRPKKSNECGSCGRVFSFDETILYHFRHLPREQQTLYLGSGAAAVFMAIFLASIGLLWVGVLILLLITGLAIDLMRQLAVWK